MRAIPTGLAGHLAGEATTICYGWRVTRRDAVVLGFTEHDRDLVFGGTIFLAASGFAASEAEQALGMAASAEEVEGGLSSVAIDEADLASGRYDGARVELFVVNWKNPAQHMLLNIREIGEVSRSGDAFRVELRSLAHRLGQPQGRVYGRRCDASLGDRRCRVNLSAWRGNGLIDAVIDKSRIVVSGLSGFAEGFFGRGIADFAGGSKVDIEVHERRADGKAVLTFWLPLEQAVLPGQAVTLTAGCDKTVSTCRGRFANLLNFRGFPHVPGSDFAYSYVDGERLHDGGALFE